MSDSNPDRSELLAALRTMPMDQYRNVTLNYPRRTGQREFRAVMEELWDRLHPDLTVVHGVAAKHLPEGDAVVGREAAFPCEHVSMSGAEGPVITLGRWPVLWSCDSCGVTIRYDTTPVADTATPDTRTSHTSLT